MSGPTPSALARMTEWRKTAGCVTLVCFNSSGVPANHDVGDAEAEDFVGLLEKRFGLGNVIVEVFAHADGLSSLTRKNIRVFHRFV